MRFPSILQPIPRSTPKPDRLLLPALWYRCTDRDRLCPPPADRVLLPDRPVPTILLQRGLQAFAWADSHGFGSGGCVNRIIPDDTRRGTFAFPPPWRMGRGGPEPGLVGRAAGKWEPRYCGQEAAEQTREYCAGRPHDVRVARAHGFCVAFARVHSSCTAR